MKVINNAFISKINGSFSVLTLFDSMQHLSHTPFENFSFFSIVPHSCSFPFISLSAISKNFINIFPPLSSWRSISRCLTFLIYPLFLADLMDIHGFSTSMLLYVSIPDFSLKVQNHLPNYLLYIFTSFPFKVFKTKLTIFSMNIYQ